MAAYMSANINASVAIAQKPRVKVFEHLLIVWNGHNLPFCDGLCPKGS